MFNDEDDYGGFSVKFEDNEENREVYRHFKDFARNNTQDNYLLAIDRLLEIYEVTKNMEVFYAHLEDVASEVERLRQKVEEDEDNETETEQDEQPQVF